MFEKEFSISKNAQATLVSLVCSNFKEHSSEEETLRSLQELKELLKTLGVSTKGQYIQNRKTVVAGTILGKGKLQEIGKAAKEQGSTLLVFDIELTAGQIKNIGKITGLPIVDRCHIILEIFAEHARTREAKIQIDMARLQYILPRLSGFWSHLSRQKGGVGVMGGEGEQQIELDRRIIRERIEFYKKELVKITKSREQQKKQRKNKTVIAALVGYTNAGKSSLMNRLCRVNITEEDQLFATLDPTFRTLTPHTKPPMILIDTVGFISNLPNALVDGFKTTLESALEADLLIIVCDMASPHYKKHLEVTDQVLNDLGMAKKDRIIVFTKKDLLDDPIATKITLRAYPNSFLVSTFDKSDIKSLRESIIDHFLKQQEVYELFIPYESGDAHSIVISNANIVSSKNHEKGIFYKIRIPSFIFKNLGVQKFILGEKDPLRQELFT